MAYYKIYRRRNYFKLSLTLKIVFVNLLFWLATVIAVSINSDLIKYFALQPLSIIQGKYLWTIFSSMFSHVFFWHIFANMVTLFFIGNFVERLLGRKRYLSFYLISGIIASLFFISLSVFFGNTFWGERIFGSPEIFALGASGAIFGLAGLITILIPKMKVLVFFIIPMPMWIAMIFFLGFFWILSTFAGLPIGNSAHLGGFITGIVYGLYLKNKYKNKMRYISRLFS